MNENIILIIIIMVIMFCHLKYHFYNSISLGSIKSRAMNEAVALAKKNGILVVTSGNINNIYKFDIC